jgi:acetyltransferase-like isoleucine patch superfamily enzyme
MQSVLAFILRICAGTASRCRNLLYRALGADIRGYAWLRRISIPRNWADVTLEENAALDDGVVLIASGPRKRGKLLIGSGTYVNRYTIFDAHEQLHIGRRVMIGPHCYFTDADHGTEPGASVQSQPMRVAPLVVEDEAWIGAHVTVLAGVRIGKGAVVGAGSVVTRDVPPMAIAAGVPATVIGSRQAGEGA